MKIQLKYFFILLSTVMLVYIFSLYERAPHVDDAWIGEQVYWLNNDGVVKNVLMTNISNNEEELLVYHKAFVVSGLLLVKLFGFNLISLKSVSLLCFLLFILLFYFYLGDIRRLLSAKYYFIAVGLFLVNPLIFEYSFVFRPEIMLMTIGFLSFLFLEQSLIYPEKKFLFVSISSVLSALCLLMHLNGLIFVIAGAIVLLYRKEFKLFLIFSFITAIGLYLYFSHLKSYEEFIIWFNIIRGIDNVDASSSNIWNFGWSLLLNIINEQKRYFHSPKEIVMTLLVVVSVITAYRVIKKRTPLVMPYLLILMISLAIIAPGKTTKYLIPLMPYFSIIVLVAIKFNFKMNFNKSQVKFYHHNSYYLFVVLIVYISFSFAYDILISMKKDKSELYSQITNDYVKNDVENTIVLAPMTFIFDEIVRYKEVRGLMSYRERMKTMSDLKGQEFFNLANKENIDFIIVNDYYMELFDIESYRSTDSIGGYKFAGEYSNYFIFTKAGD